MISGKAKNKVLRSSAVALSEWKCRIEADAVERQLVLAQLEEALTKYTDDQKISWYAHEVELQAGSSLYEIYNPGRLLLNELLETTPVNSALSQERATKHNGLIRVTADGKMEVRSASGWIDLVAAGYFRESKATQPILKLISDVAEVAGGYIWPDNDMTLDQWFRFHDIKLPENKAKVRELIALFKFDPRVDEPGNYWEHFESDNQALVALSEEQFAAIRNATAKLMPQRKLLTALYNVTGRSAVTHESAAQLISQFVNYSVSRSLASDYLKELGWFGGNEGQEVADDILRQLLTTAILLDLDPSVGHGVKRNCVAGIDLYAPKNVDRHPSDIREEVAISLRSRQWVDAGLEPLAVNLLMARNAPEFLVREIPSSVPLGSIAWINFCRAVILVETVKTGATRFMTYAQIMAYGELEPVSEPHKHKRDLAMIDPIVDWALINRIVTTDELEQAEETSTRRALDAFERHSETFVQIARAFSSPLPDRVEIARAALKIAAPGCDSLDEKALSEKGGQQVMSMIDLHQSGDLVTGQWDRRTVRLVTNGVPRPAINYNPSGVSLYTRYPNLLKLGSCDEEMDRQLAVHFDDLNSAMLSTVKLACAQMPEADLQAFMNSDIHFFTVRESAVYLKSRRLGGPLDIKTERETQQSRDAATGRFGIVMYATYENADICYELFTSRAETRKNDALAAFIKRERKLQQRSRMSAAANPTTQVSITTTESLPLDVKRYTHAAAEDASIHSSMAIIDYFGMLKSPPTISMPKQGFYQKFNDSNIARIAGFLVEHRPYLNKKELRELVRIPTPLELSKEEGERLLTYFIDLVVPFKRCIEDIASGEHDKVVDGIYGCLMDGIGLIGTVAGAGSKVLSISAKAISTTSKAARFTRLAFTSAISLFNPLDGVPSGIQAGSKLVQKGYLRFSKNSHELIAKANSQLHTFSGRRQSYDLISASHAHLGLGNWKPRGATGNIVAVLAARSGNKWYALNRRGNMWGNPLQGFAYQAPVRFPHSPRTLPASYTRNFIEKSLPRARAKIDNAIDVISQHDFKRDGDLLMKALFGNTSKVATDRLVNYLRLIRFDFAGFSMSNTILDGFKNNESIASFDVDSYKRWKSASSSEASGIAFVEIYTQNLNKHFVNLGFNHDVVADDLIHELFHGSAQTVDVGYAIDTEHTSNSGQRLDVTQLLNLASGNLRVTDSIASYHAVSDAFENADSLGLATSLLSQMMSDKVTFDDNMAIVRRALDASGGKTIVEPIVITLNKPR
ncbi:MULTISPECIES: hypothetical protein [unclassified Pseudomonas]|uniref:hypothetical protein n=1 Tax=unclassified Pseudomonas TaxID=196821 RepID=UPI001F593BE9|nr:MULTISPECIES: hypothetical protein [unclassified Pseudomonas]